MIRNKVKQLEFNRPDKIEKVMLMLLVFNFYFMKRKKKNKFLVENHD